MSRFHRRAGPAVALLATLVLSAGSASAAPTQAGPSTATDPYVLPAADGVETTSIFTVSDALAAGNGYEMSGIPDGLGAVAQGRNLVVYMNQELNQTAGAVRHHGERGAFVSRLVLDPSSLEVKSGSDWINPGVQYWDYPNGTFSAEPDAIGTGSTADLRAFARFCSGDLTSPSQLFNPTTRAGYRGDIFFANEEVNPDGRAFAVLQDGSAWQLPRLGQFSWENTLAAFNETDTTVVMGNEDGPANGSQLWVYAGEKQRHGTAIEKAGLHNGTNFVVRVNDTATNDAATRTLAAAPGGVGFDLVEVDWNQSGTDQNDDALAGMSLTRIEDGEFDPHDKNVFYFLTTEGSPANPPETPSRDGGGLWVLTFEDVEDPEAGGTLELLLDGTEAVYSESGGESSLNKPDNMTIDTHGNVLIQEDPGENAHLARIVSYRIADGALGVVARFDPELFSDDSVITDDEESSGIIDTEAWLGAGTFLFDAQVHADSPTPYPAGAALSDPTTQVEHGQLLQLFVPDWDAVYGSIG